MNEHAESTELDNDLLDLRRGVVKAGEEIATLSNKRPNRIVSVGPAGVLVETLRSERYGSGPQLIPAWMIVSGWEHLRRNGELTNQQLVNDLNVKSLAFVCALLAKFPDVVVRSTRPIILERIPR